MTTREWDAPTELVAWAKGSGTLWEDVEIAWYSGQRKKPWVCSHTPRWYYSLRWRPFDILPYGLVSESEGKRWIGAFPVPVPTRRPQ